MTKKEDGVFEIEQTLEDDVAFKIIGHKDWGDSDWGNLFAEGNTGFLGPKGSNGNITFSEGGKIYIITVNLKQGVYTIVEKP